MANISLQIRRLTGANVYRVASLQTKLEYANYFSHLIKDSHGVRVLTALPRNFAETRSYPEQLLFSI